MLYQKPRRRPFVSSIAIGDAFKRITVRPHCDQVRTLIEELDEKHEFGLMMGGYEAGICSVRALINQCIKDGT